MAKFKAFNQHFYWKEKLHPLKALIFFRMKNCMAYTKKLTADAQSFPLFVDVVYLLLTNSALLVSGPIKTQQTS